MNPATERKLLKAIARAEHREPQTLLAKTTVMVCLWLILSIVTLAVFQLVGHPTPRELKWAVGAVVVGTVFGGWIAIRACREQWCLMRKFVNFKAVKARLAEIES